MDTITIENKQFQQLIIALQRTSDMLALNLVKDCKKQNEKIVMLSDFGYSPSDISRILNTTANTASNAISRARKTRPNKGKDTEANELKDDAKTSE